LQYIITFDGYEFKSRSNVLSTGQQKIANRTYWEKLCVSAYARFIANLSSAAFTEKVK